MGCKFLLIIMILVGFKVLMGQILEDWLVQMATMTTLEKYIKQRDSSHPKNDKTYVNEAESMNIKMTTFL